MNRTKRRWKNARLGATWRLYYRHGIERATRRDLGRRGRRTRGPELQATVDLLRALAVLESRIATIRSSCSRGMGAG